MHIHPNITFKIHKQLKIKTLQVSNFNQIDVIFYFLFLFTLFVTLTGKFPAQITPHYPPYD